MFEIQNVQDIFNHQYVKKRDLIPYDTYNLKPDRSLFCPHQIGMCNVGSDELSHQEKWKQDKYPRK